MLFGEVLQIQGHFDQPGACFSGGCCGIHRRLEGGGGRMVGGSVVVVVVGLMLGMGGEEEVEGRERLGVAPL